MNFTPKTTLEIINEKFNWTDTMQSIQEQYQCSSNIQEKQDEFQAEPVDDINTEFDERFLQFTPEEKYETIPILSIEALESLKKKYENYIFISETLDIILRWKQDQEKPFIANETQSLYDMTNDTLLKHCIETEKYRKYCDKCTDNITSSWKQESIAGLLSTLDNTEKEVEVFHYEIDRRCYLGTWFPENT